MEVPSFDDPTAYSVESSSERNRNHSIPNIGFAPIRWYEIQFHRSRTSRSRVVEPVERRDVLGLGRFDRSSAKAKLVPGLPVNIVPCRRDFGRYMNLSDSWDAMMILCDLEYGLRIISLTVDSSQERRTTRRRQGHSRKIDVIRRLVTASSLIESTPISMDRRSEDSNWVGGPSSTSLPYIASSSRLYKLQTALQVSWNRVESKRCSLNIRRCRGNVQTILPRGSSSPGAGYYSNIDRDLERLWRNKLLVSRSSWWNFAVYASPPTSSLSQVR